MDKTKKIKLIKIISVVVFLLLFALITYISYRAEYLQILEIGEEYIDVFNTKNEYKVKIFFATFVILFFIMTITNNSIKKGIKPFFDDEKKVIPQLPNKSIALIVSVIGSIIIMKNLLGKAILFLNSTWFGINEPIFGLDIGFYFFQKPFIELILNYIMALLILLVIYV